MLVCVPNASVLERDSLVARIVCDATVGETLMPRKKSNLIKSILIAAFTASRRREALVPRDSRSLNIQVHASVKKLFMGPALCSVRFLSRELEPEEGGTPVSGDDRWSRSWATAFNRRDIVRSIGGSRVVSAAAREERRATRD